MPASGQGVTAYTDITDFTKGIASGWRTGAGTQPGGETLAQLGETWGCIGPPEGGLVPGPRLVDFGSQSWSVGTAPTNGAPSELRIVDMVALPGWLSNQDTTLGHWKGPQASRAQDLVVFNTGHFHNDVYRHAFHVYQAPNDLWVNQQAGITRTVLGSNLVTTYGTGSIAALRSAVGNGSFIAAGPVNINPNSPQGGWFFTVFHHYTAQWLSGTATFGQTSVYPDPVGAFTFRTWDNVSPHLYPRRLFTHQNRLCYTSLNGNNAVTSEFLSFTNTSPTSFFSAFSDQQIRFHDANAIPNAVATYYINTDPGSMPGMTGAVHSLNSGALLMVRSQGGGVVVSGDFRTSPSVTLFPQVESTGYNFTHNCMTPFGMVYGSDNGVFAWNGSDTSQPLAPLLEGQFWSKPSWNDTTRRSPNTPMGRFSFRYPYLYAPYNWVMDARTGGWWRVHPTPEQDASGREVGNWSVSPTGSGVWGSNLETARGNSEQYVRFDPERAAPKWQWRSQPMVLGRNRFSEIREINAVLQGVGTVVIQVDGISGQSGSVTFNVNSSDRPFMYSAPISVDAHDPTVRITATGAGGTGDAPRLYRLSIGHREDRSVA